MFTRQTLRRLANANSFQRGQDDDDEGNLTKLCREADDFYASVRGSRSCRVALRLAAVGLEFGPYAFDGICKHSVALGLAVLDAYTPADLASASATPAAGPPAMPADELAKAVHAAWADRKKGDKLRFLKQALTKSDDLARQFLGFGNQLMAASPADLLATLPDRPARPARVRIGFGMAASQPALPHRNYHAAAGRNRPHVPNAGAGNPHPRLSQRPGQCQARGISLRPHRPLAGVDARRGPAPHRAHAAFGPGAAAGISDPAWLARHAAPRRAATHGSRRESRREAGQAARAVAALEYVQVPDDGWVSYWPPLRGAGPLASPAARSAW